MSTLELYSDHSFSCIALTPWSLEISQPFALGQHPELAFFQHDSDWCVCVHMCCVLVANVVNNYCKVLLALVRKDTVIIVIIMKQ